MKWVKLTDKPFPFPTKVDETLNVKFKGKADVVKYDGENWVWDIINCPIKESIIQHIEWLDESVDLIEKAFTKGYSLGYESGSIGENYYSSICWEAFKSENKLCN